MQIICYTGKVWSLNTSPHLLQSIVLAPTLHLTLGNESNVFNALVKLWDMCKKFRDLGSNKAISWKSIAHILHGKCCCHEVLL
jgi:hypothetical protein